MRRFWLTALTVWIVCAATAVYIRLYPLWGHIWAPTQEKATMTVALNLKKVFLLQLHNQYPQMPPEVANRLASAQLNETLRKDKTQVLKAIERANRELYRQSGQPSPVYLLEADPFYFYNLTENIATQGRMAEVIKGNKYFNPLMGAPFGYWQPLSLHPYVGFFIYKVTSLFNPQVPLMTAVAFTPLVLVVLGLGAFIWCARLFSLGYPAILVGCFYLSMAPVFLKRSSLGWYDTDPYNLLFPFIFLGIFFKNLHTPRGWVGLALAVVLLLYSLIWQGWVFLFFMTLIFAAALAFWAFFMQKDPRLALSQGVFSGIFLLGTGLGGLLLYGPDFFSFFSEGASELGKFTVKGMNLWPNLFIEVGELKKSSLGALVTDTGGPIFWAGTLTGLGFGLWHFVRNWRQKSALKILIVALFLLVTVVMTLKAERFAIFTLLSSSLLFALGVENIFLKGGRLIGTALIALLLGFGWFNANQNIRTVLNPIYNSTWNDSLLAIKDKTEADSIINTWWPPGHFIKAVAHRRVMFDGASLSKGDIGYWMANVFLSTDETQAQGIVRMLNLSANKATEFLTGHGLKTSQAVALLKTIAGQTPAQARQTLKAFLNAEDVEHVLLLTHGGRPHSYLLVYNEIVDTNLGLAFVGRRDFQKIEMINADPRLSAAVPAPDSPEFINFLWSVSGGPPKYSESLALADQNNEKWIFQEGLTVRKDMSQALINSSQYGQGVPAGIMFARNGRIVKQEFAQANLNYMVVLYEQDGVPVCRLMDKWLADSLIMKLFFFNGQGLQHFKLLHSSSDLTARTEIKVFQVLY